MSGFKVTNTTGGKIGFSGVEISPGQTVTLKEVMAPSRMEKALIDRGFLVIKPVTSSGTKEKEDLVSVPDTEGKGDA